MKKEFDSLLPMKWDDLLDLPLREELENFCCVNSLECGYYYGIFKNDDIGRIFNEFNIDEEYPESFNVKELIHFELLGTDIRDYNILLNIMENLGISRKGDVE